jgi:TonB family protein
MSLKADDGRALWTIWVAVVVCLIGACVVRAQGPKTESNGCTMRLVDAPKPAYPVLKNKGTLRSPVVVDVTVNEDGTVKVAQLRRSCGIPLWDKAVLRAVKKWRYNASKGCGERHSDVTVNIDPK